MKELMLVGIGSFFGGSLRYVISKMIQSYAVIAFPFGTLAVNVLGCLALGLIAVLAGHQLAKLVG
jgi:fluoride exporter